MGTGTGALNLRTASNALNLSGMIFTVNSLSATDAQTLSNGAITATTLDLANITLAEGIAIDGATVSNAPANLGASGSVNLANTPQFNFSSSINITAWDTQGPATFAAPGGETITIDITPSQAIQFSIFREGTTEPLTAGQEVEIGTITFRTPAATINF